jgi:hypothetical protein
MIPISDWLNIYNRRTDTKTISQATLSNILRNPKKYGCVNPPLVLNVYNSTFTETLKYFSEVNKRGFWIDEKVYDPKSYQLEFVPAKVYFDIPKISLSKDEKNLVWLFNILPFCEKPKDTNEILNKSMALGMFQDDESYRKKYIRLSRNLKYGATSRFFSILKKPRKSSYNNRIFMTNFYYCNLEGKKLVEELDYLFTTESNTSPFSFARSLALDFV